MSSHHSEARERAVKRFTCQQQPGGLFFFHFGYYFQDHSTLGIKIFFN
jgi:hypothetical protein